jgi:hypothetical protein
MLNATTAQSTPIPTIEAGLEVGVVRASTASGVTISNGYTAHNSAPQAAPANQGAWYGVKDVGLSSAGLAMPEAAVELSRSVTADWSA